MKPKKLLPSLFIIILFSQAAYSQKIFEGKTIGSTTYESIPANLQAFLQNSTNVIYYKKGKMRMETKSPSMNLVIIFDFEKGEQMTLSDMTIAGKPIKSASLMNLPEYGSNNEKTEVLSEKKTILGRTTQKTITTTNIRGKEQKTISYVCSDYKINQGYKSSGPIYTEIPLEVDLMIEGIGPSKVETTELIEQAVGDDMFNLTVPSGYSTTDSRTARTQVPRNQTQTGILNSSKPATTSKLVSEEELKELLATIPELELKKKQASDETNYALAGQYKKQIDEIKEKEALLKARAIAKQQKKENNAKELLNLKKQLQDAVAVEDFPKAAELKRKINKLNEIDDLEKEKKEAVENTDYAKASEINKRIIALKAIEDADLPGGTPAEQTAPATTTNLVQVVKTTDASGQVTMESEQINGQMNGVTKMYYKNGKLLNETTYKDNVANGMMKIYNEDGILISEQPFVDGKISGVSRGYNPETGRLVMEIEYSNNVMNGEYKIYDERGRAIMEMNYVDGVQMGKTKIGEKNVSQTHLAGTVATNNAGSGSSSGLTVAGGKSSTSSSGQTFAKSTSGTYVRSESVKLKDAEENKVVRKYRRSSLYTMLAQDDNRLFANVISQTFVDAPLPSKFNDHNLDGKIINSYGSKDPSGIIDQYLQTNQIAKSLVAKWFNRNEKGTFNMDLVAQRGNYNATSQDLSIATKSARGNALLADAGEDLIGNTFVIVYDFNYVNEEEVANKTKMGLSLGSTLLNLAGGPDLSAVTTVANAGLTVAGKGYVIRTMAYLYKLVWNDEVAATFYQDYWMDDSSFDPAKKAAFENSNIFTLKFVGQQSGLAHKQSNVFTSKTDEELIAIATTKSIDESIAKLQRKFEEFKTKTPLTSVNPLAAEIGLKEGLEPGDVFEVLEQVQDPATGKTKYEKRGTISVGKDIWDNTYNVAEANPNAANMNQFTTFKGSGNFYPGMLIKQVK